MSKPAKLYRGFRNLICQLSLVGVCALDPLATFLLPGQASKVVGTYARIFVFVVAVGYTHCLMHEESRQAWLGGKKPKHAETMVISKKNGKTVSSKAPPRDMNKLFAAKVKEYS